jgi:hypothetical protein
MTKSRLEVKKEGDEIQFPKKDYREVGRIRWPGKEKGPGRDLSKVFYSE